MDGGKLRTVKDNGSYIDKIQKTRDIFLGWGVQHGAVRIVKNLLKVSTSNPSQKLTPFSYTQ